jgi:hypothetical protein
MSFKSSLSTALSAALFGLFVLVPVGINAQEGLTLTVDRLEYTSLHFIHQNISVKNDTSRLVRDVRVECDFFNKGELIATGFAYVKIFFLIQQDLKWSLNQATYLRTAPRAESSRSND